MNAQELTARARRRFHEGSLGGALLDCKEAVRLAPPGPALARALVHVARGEWAEGLAAAEAVSDTPELALWCCAEARLGLGDRAAALALWSRILEDDPLSRTAWKDRGVLRALLGDRAGAQDDLARAAKLSPGDVVPHLWIAGLGGESAPLQPFARGRDWASHLARLVQGAAQEAVLAEAALAPTETERTERRCQVQGYLGLLAERAGDLARAFVHYEACAATGTWHFVTHMWARERLRDERSR